MDNIDRAEQLLRLAVDAGTTEEERRSAAVALAKMLHTTDFFPTVRTLLCRVQVLVDWFRQNRPSLNRMGARLPADF
jgi:hypothetical protein